jgi:hypothetical protein
VPSARVTASATLAVLLAIAFAFGHFGKNTFEMRHEWSFAKRGALLVAFAACLVRMLTWQNSPFLYFQF